MWKSSRSRFTTSSSVPLGTTSSCSWLGSSLSSQKCSMKPRSRCPGWRVTYRIERSCARLYQKLHRNRMAATPVAGSRMTMPLQPGCPNSLPRSASGQHGFQGDAHDAGGDDEWRLLELHEQPERRGCDQYRGD